MTTWLNVVKAGEYTGFHPNTIRLAAQRGELSGVKRNKNAPRSSWRFTTDDLDAWLEKGRLVAAPKPKRRAS